MTQRASAHRWPLRACLPAALVLVLAGCTWPMFRFGPARTGHNPYERTLGVANVATLREAWTAAVDVASSPVVSGGVVYVGGTQQLYAFDAAGVRNCGGSPRMCTPLWTANTGHVVEAPTVVGSAVYVASRNGTLYAFDAAGTTNCSGSPKHCAPLWTAGLGARASSSPVVDDGVVYVGGDGVMQAFDAAGATNCSATPTTCAPLWVADTGDAVAVSSPAVADGTVYVGSFAGRSLYAFDAKGVVNCSGTPKRCLPLWASDTVTPAGSPTVANGVVYLSVEYGRVLAFDARGVTGCAGAPKRCAPLWRTGTTNEYIGNPPAVANGLLYRATQSWGLWDARVAVYDANGRANCGGTPKECDPLFEAPAGSTILGPPSVANGVVYFSSLDGKLYAYDASGTVNCAGTPRRCTPLWSPSLGADYSPAVVNARVYASGVGLHVYELPPG
jgi:outer membrane protein assembly factor BamB